MIFGCDLDAVECKIKEGGECVRIEEFGKRIKERKRRKKMEEKFLQERGVDPPPLCLESVTLTTRP